MVREVFPFLLTGVLDMGDTHLRPRALVFAACALFVILTAVNANASARSTRAIKSLVPTNAEQLDKNCARLPMTFTATTAWLAKRLKKEGLTLHFRTVVDIPGVFAQNAEFETEVASWTSVNVSRIGSTVHVCFIEKTPSSL